VFLSNIIIHINNNRILQKKIESLEFNIKFMKQTLCYICVIFLDINQQWHLFEIKINLQKQKSRMERINDLFRKKDEE